MLDDLHCHLIMPLDMGFFQVNTVTGISEAASPHGLLFPGTTTAPGSWGSEHEDEGILS